MEPKETLEIRKEMVEMHDEILKRIDELYDNKEYIAVCWLCYACFENRVNRVLDKICFGCTKDKRKRKQHIGIVTKLECYNRLIKTNYPLLQDEDIDLINTVKGWCSERNKLIHDMVSLEMYHDFDKKFMSLAKCGKDLVKKMYSFGTDVRNKYYQIEEIPLFDSNVIRNCKLKYKCVED